MPLLARTKGALDTVNRQPALLGALRELRRRLPGDPEFGDALSTAGEPTLAYLVQGVAAISPSRDSVVSEVGLTGLQVWQSLAERAGRGRGDVELALLYADLVDSSALALSAGDDLAVAMLGTVAGVLERCVTSGGGRVVRRLGDGIIATFVSVPAAVEAALDIQDALLEIEIDGHRPRMRTGVHFGRPRRLGGEFVGSEVTVLAAIGARARPGQVLASGPALDRLDARRDGLRVGRRKRLRSEAAPAGMQVAMVRRSP